MLVHDVFKRLREVGIAQAVVKQIGLQVCAVLRERHVGGILHARTDGVGQDGVGFAVVDLGINHLAIQSGISLHEVGSGFLGKRRGGVEVELRACGHFFLRLGVKLVVGHRRGLFQRIAHVVGQSGCAGGQHHRAGQNQRQKSFHEIHPPSFLTWIFQKRNIFFTIIRRFAGNCQDGMCRMDKKQMRLCDRCAMERESCSPNVRGRLAFYFCLRYTVRVKQVAHTTI